MFLELWNLTTLIGDLLELITNHIESGTVFLSLPFIIFLIILGTISVVSWKSTYIPDLPPAPRPPYVIQISSSPSPLNNNGERNTLSDVRLLSSGADVDRVLRRFPAPSQGINHRIQAVRSSSQQNLPGSITVTQRVFPQTHQQQQGPRQDGQSVLLGLLRPGSVIRPFLSNRSTNGGSQAQNLIVYHRVNVYHHHHHHHPGSSSSQASSSSTTESNNHQQQPSSESIIPSTATLVSQSVDSSTQYETEDTTTSTSSNINIETIPQSDTNQVEIELSAGINVNNMDAGEIQDEITIQSGEEQSSSLSSSRIQNINVPLSSEGLRHRTSSSVLHQVSHNNEGSVSNSSSSNQTTIVDHENPQDHHHHHQLTEINKEADTRSGESDISSTPTPVVGVTEFRFIIKFLNDTQMEVTSQVGENIADFKRRHFATELAENKTVRLIFNGRVLDNDTRTLRESGIFDQCVVHCLIVSRPSNATNTSTASGGGSNQTGIARRSAGIMRAPEPGMFFVAFIGVFLIFLWFICFHFGQHLFTQSAVVSLTVLTAIFLIGLVAFYLPVHPNQ